MKNRKKPRISLCMIVKNEEKKLERSISWGADILWEKIVVDTGSMDGTVRLAKKLGADVYHFEWIDDFAAARNFALEQAAGDWILMIDADEYPAPETPEKLLSLVNQAEEAGADGIIGQILNLGKEGTIAAKSARVLLFRNVPKLRYHRRIHELLGHVDGQELKLADAGGGLDFFHDGYAGEAYEKKQKSRRNLNLLEKEYADHTDDYEIMGYIGDEYRSFGEIAHAKKWYERSVEYMPEALPEKAPRSAKTLAALISLYTADGEYEKAEKTYHRAVHSQPLDADFDYLMGSACMAKDQWQDAANYLGKSLLKLEKYGSTNCSLQASANLENIYENLGLCFLRSGKRQEAVQTSVALLKATPYNLRALYVLLSAFYEDGGDRAKDRAYVHVVEGFLGKIYRLSVPEDRSFIARAAKEAGWEAMKIQMEGEPEI